MVTVLLHQEVELNGIPVPGWEIFLAMEGVLYSVTWGLW